MKLKKFAQYYFEWSPGRLVIYREKLNTLEESLVHNQEALRQNPDDIPTRFALGNILRMQGRIQEARNAYTLVAQSDSPWAESATQLLTDLEGKVDFPRPIDRTLEYASSIQLWSPTLTWKRWVKLVKERLNKQSFEPEATIAMWRALLATCPFCWVVFTQGTCVVVDSEGEDVQVYASQLLSNWGPRAAGSSFGDFRVQPLSNEHGWLIIYHHPNILNYVLPGEVDEPATTSKRVLSEQAVQQLHAKVGLLGRQKRHDDSQSLQILYIHRPETNVQSTG